MLREAARLNQEQGQWYSNDLIVEALRRADASTYIGTNGGRALYEFDMGRPIGRVYAPNGTVIADVTRVRVVRYPDGTLRTAFPIR